MAFSITLILIFTAVALLLTDLRCRELTFNDTSPIVAFQKDGGVTYANVDLFGVTGTYDISTIANLWYGFADFICFPHK